MSRFGAEWRPCPVLCCHPFSFRPEAHARGIGKKAQCGHCARSGQLHKLVYGHFCVLGFLAHFCFVAWRENLGHLKHLRPGAPPVAASPRPGL